MGLQTWIPVITGAVAAVAGAIGLPKLLADRRERKTKPAGKPNLVTQLPTRVKLVDRVTELAQVLRYLADGEPVVTVEGGRGVGKSALVLEAAHRHAAAGRGKAAKRPAALVWLNAQNDCPDLADLARKLSLSSGERSLTAAAMSDKAEAIRSYLAAHPTVLIVDNLRLSQGGTAPLRELFAMLPSGSQAIISSNAVGVLDGPRVAVPELVWEDARTLVVREAERAGVAGLKASDDSVLERVHRLVGGNPGAIRLFVAACAGRPGTVAEVLDEIESGAGETATLYGVIWTELPEGARSALAACALLAGGADQEQVATALGSPRPEVKESLRKLWIDGLVEDDQALDRTIYRCPPALRRFVLDHAGPERLRGARIRLATALTERFTKDWEDAAGAATQVEAIRTLLRDLAGDGEYRLCLDLFAAVYDILFTLGLFDDRIELGWGAYQAAAAAGLVEEQSLALSVVSSTHAVRGEDAEAARAVATGLEIARKAGSAREIARQLRCEGFRLFRAGRAEEALAAIEPEDAEAMARNAGDPNNMIDILSLVGAAQFHLGDLDACEATVLRFRDECERLPWERGKAYALRDLAEVRLMRGDRQAAEELAARARTIAVEWRDSRQLARIMLTEARLHLFAGRMRAAQEAASEAARTARKLPLPGEQAEAEAVAREAVRCRRMPWRRPRVTGKPVLRFTEWTIGGD